MKYCLKTQTCLVSMKSDNNMSSEIKSLLLISSEIKMFSRIISTVNLCQESIFNIPKSGIDIVFTITLSLLRLNEWTKVFLKGEQN